MIRENFITKKYSRGAFTYLGKSERNLIKRFAHVNFIGNELHLVLTRMITNFTFRVLLVFLFGLGILFFVVYMTSPNFYHQLQKIFYHLFPCCNAVWSTGNHLLSIITLPNSVTQFQCLFHTQNYMPRVLFYA